MTETIRIPKVFYDDHYERCLPAPPVVRETKRHYFIEAVDTPALRELVSDADYYSMTLGLCRDYHGLSYSARATFKAIRKALPEVEQDGISSADAYWEDVHEPDVARRCVVYGTAALRRRGGEASNERA